MRRTLPAKSSFSTLRSFSSGVLQDSCHFFLGLFVYFMRLLFAPPAQADPGLDSLLLYAPNS